MIRNISYSRDAFSDPDQLIKNAKRALTGVDYDTMVGTGLSGSLVIPTLARALGKEWAIIRKASESSHAGAGFEGTIGKRWIFVDDFMETGSTERAVMQGVREATDLWNRTMPAMLQEPLSTYVGAYLYSWNSWRPNYR